jgi:hypothetical protein
MVTFPLVTFLILNPTVGIISSLKPPVCNKTTKRKGLTTNSHKFSASGAKRTAPPHTYSNDIHKRRFPGILEPYQGKLHLLLEEEAAGIKS